MRIEIIRDKMPLRCLWFSANSALNMFEKILFVAGRLGSTSGQLARDNIKIEYEGQCSVSDLFKLAPLHFTWEQRQIWMFTLQRLHTRHFIYTLNALTLFR